MYYLQSRYYNPEWGRFINADAIVGQTGELLGHNVFAYCKSNPVNRQDPSGFLSFSATDGASSSDSHISDYVGAALDVLSGGFTFAAGVARCSVPTLIPLGVASMAYGASSAISGASDIKNRALGENSKVGKNNIVKNTWQAALGKDLGTKVYYGTDIAIGAAGLGMGIGASTMSQFAKTNSFILENTLFGISKNVTSVKNLFTSGYNLSASKIIIWTADKGLSTRSAYSDLRGF